MVSEHVSYYEGGYVSHVIDESFEYDYLNSPPQLALRERFVW